MRWEITGQPGSHREVSLGIQMKGSGHSGCAGRTGDGESLANESVSNKTRVLLRVLEGSKLG